CRFISRYHLNSFFLFVILSHFFCICVPAIRALHSFPTRRSSDLHTGGGPRPFHTMWLVSRTFVLLGSDVMETFGVPWFIADRHLGPPLFLLAVGGALLLWRRPRRTALAWAALTVNSLAASLPFLWIGVQVITG